MNNLEAYKMDGLGNDFIIFDKRKKSITLTKDQIIKISSRNNIGCDQVIFIDNDETSDVFLTLKVRLTHIYVYQIFIIQFSL